MGHFRYGSYPFNPFLPEWLPHIIGIILPAGIYFGLTRGYLALKSLVPDPHTRTKVMIMPTLFVLFMVNLLLKLFMG